MTVSILNLPSEVTYITPGGPMEIRMSDHTPDAICDAAKALKARRYVSVVEWDRAEQTPVWGVFETSSGEIIKQFSTMSSAPAVVFACTARRS